MNRRTENAIPHFSMELYEKIRNTQKSVRVVGYLRQLEISKRLFEEQDKNWMFLLLKADFQFHGGEIDECKKTYSTVAHMLRGLKFCEADRKYVKAYLSYRNIAIKYVQRMTDFQQWDLLKTEIEAIPANEKIKQVFKVIIPV